MKGFDFKLVFTSLRPVKTQLFRVSELDYALRNKAELAGTIAKILKDITRDSKP